jgi:hypothetical protein
VCGIDLWTGQNHELIPKSQIEMVQCLSQEDSALQVSENYREPPALQIRTINGRVAAVLTRAKLKRSTHDLGSLGLVNPS